LMWVIKHCDQCFKKWKNSTPILLNPPKERQATDFWTGYIAISISLECSTQVWHQLTYWTKLWSKQSRAYAMDFH
jgi:hypothetical protein